MLLSHKSSACTVRTSLVSTRAVVVRFFKHIRTWYLHVALGSQYSLHLLCVRAGLRDSDARPVAFVIS